MSTSILAIHCLNVLNRTDPAGQVINISKSNMFEWFVFEHLTSV